MKPSYAALLTLFFIFLILSCENPKQNSAETLIESAVIAHGMAGFNKTNVQFKFRDYQYAQDRDAQGLVYTRKKNTTPEILDVLHSKNGFKRTVNNEKIILSDSIAVVYSESVNSVLYFFRLPYSLKDRGAIKTLMNTETIKGKSYQKVGVHFTPKNGGIDYQDTFRYWFDEQTNTLDYLAYQYHTNGGGVRFRAAINRRSIDGVLFQDYENYKAPKNTSLDDLTVLYEQKKLELLSLIVNDSIRLIKP
jgi:hypothetical protein